MKVIHGELETFIYPFVDEDEPDDFDGQDHERIRVFEPVVPMGVFIEVTVSGAYLVDKARELSRALDYARRIARQWRTEARMRKLP